MKPALALVLTACVVGAAIAYDVRHVELEADISQFVPKLSDSTQLAIVRALSQAPAGRLCATTFGGADESARRQAARSLADSLARDPAFAWATTGSGLSGAERTEDGMTQVLFDHRFGLMDVPLEDGRIPDAELQRRARAMLDTLATPLGGMLRPLLPKDPLFAFGDLITRLRKSAGSAVTDMGGVWETVDGQRTLVLAVARADALSGQGQKAAIAALEAALAELEAASPGLRADSTSVGHYAVGAERVIRGDIQRISLWSTVGIVVLYLLAFRSLRWPLVLLLPVGCGVAVALAGVALLFGPVHGMALAFGAGLLGVAVDYAAHYLVHRAADPDASAAQVMQKVFVGITLGAVTTVVGVAAFIATPAVGFRQMGVLAAIGILVALFVTRFVLPALAGGATRGAPRGLAPLTAVGRALRVRPRLTRALTLLLLLPALAGLSRARFDDDVRKLQPELPEVEAESQRVREALGRTGDHDRLIVAVGNDDDAALRTAEHAFARVRSALATEGASPSAGLGALRAPSRQAEVLAALKDDPTLQTRLDEALAQAGFAAGAFTPLRELLADAPPPLSPASVLEATWGRPWSLARVPLDEDRVAYTLPVPPGHEDTLPALTASMDDVYFVDPPEVMSDAYGSFRARALWLFAVGLVLVWLVLMLRYRAVYPATACWLSAVVSAAAALGVQALFGIAFNPLHLLGVLLVASMAVDYSVYQLEANDPREQPVSLSSATLAALTTTLSLGLLGTSKLPALSAIGLTATIGVVYALLCAAVVAGLQERA